MIDQETLQIILGIKERVHITKEDMADNLNITFFPYVDKNISENIVKFSQRLKETFQELNVNIVPYEKSLIKIPLYKVYKNVIKILINNVLYSIRFILGLSQKTHYFNLDAIKYLFQRTKIKKGISVVVLGEQSSKNLPMQYIYSFKDSSIITILDFPKNITEKSDFHEHFDTALKLFTHNMTNIVIGVNEHSWLLYNFNASHPIFPIDLNFKENILNALIPKIVAPIRPYLLSEFQISKDHFNLRNKKYQLIVEDIVNGALIFSKTNLYPTGKKIDDLPFRNNFYRWIGKLHLDNRNGMSYGFLAIQLPGEVSKLIEEDDFKKQVTAKIDAPYLIHNDCIYISLTLYSKKYWLKIPDVWVLSQKSGSDKTHVNPYRDLIKLGLSNGKMIIETHEGAIIDNDYKTSFDTQVILAHSLGNAIIASVLSKINPQSEFLRRYKEKGISISHWHGYIHPDYIPKGWFVHGVTNPHVACSSPQSALYAIQGKLDSFLSSLESNNDFKGDIHIEPHHGTNICYTSIADLANYLVENPQASILGNSYLYLYNK
jgi:hypothetical protein